MAKRRKAVGKRKKSHSHKTKKRLAAKHALLAKIASKRRKKK